YEEMVEFMEKNLLSVAYKIISSIEQKEESRICEGILRLLDSHLIPSSTAAESKSAQDIAAAELAPTHPIRDSTLIMQLLR
uniref:14-3-3-like protein 1 (Fragments) n=1 Tax=Pseudotsuga menziesii TaxID=3357 RepID=14331_PSEMZ|nr:RecName: Full=14-3-3-like protein 1 [Pseudotsuga menziesii]